MRCILILLSSLVLAGCSGGNKTVRGTGEYANPPAGFVDYCNRHPEQAECGGTQ